MLINANKLTKFFGDELLFSDVTFSVEERDKIGFIGINGAGKSSLFKIMLDMMSYDSGELYKSKGLKIGYLEQYACTDSDKTVFGEVEAVYSELSELEKELDMIRWEIENNPESAEALIDRQAKLQEKFISSNGAYYKGIIKSCLTGLGFSEGELSKRVRDLSGGQRTRVSLAKILLSDCNLLLLDEPTNHLDISSVEWLEEFLRSYKGAFIVISHDRYFLDKVTQKTFSMENGKLYTGGGNYSTFIKQREIDRLTEERNYENTRREIKRLEGIIEQQKRWNREKNIKTAESKQKVIDRLEKTLAEPEKTLSELSFSFKSLPGGGEETLVAEGVTKAYDSILMNNTDFFVKKGERIFLLGKNGCGKTTFLKIITGEVAPDAGRVTVGANVQIGYYDQIQETLNTEKTVIEEIWDEYPRKTETELRNALAAFLFRGEDVFKPISKLSGGERARVQLVKLILKPVNFLILDEPTNHLDIESREALEKALLGYDGTILAVSHDRYFINKLATRIANFENEKIVTYVGGYDYFLEKHTEETREEPAGKEKNLGYEERKRLASEQRKKQTQLKRTEERITELEQEIEDLNKALMESGSDFEKATMLSEEAEQKSAELSKLYEKWEELSCEV